MNKMQRTDLFKQELSLIRDDQLRAFAEQCLADSPEYFFHIPASSSGKYHPAYALGEGGLIRHTKAAIHIAHMIEETGIPQQFYRMDLLPILDATPTYDFQGYMDEVFFALIFHDCMKQGLEDLRSEENAVTKHEHPILAANFVTEEYFKHGSALFTDTRAYNRIARITKCIASHMGKWSISRYSSVVLPTPEMGIQQGRLVHLADYLASRKCLEYIPSNEVIT